VDAAADDEESDDADDEDEPHRHSPASGRRRSDYEVQRLERIHRNEKKLSELGLLQPISSHDYGEGPPTKPLAKQTPKPVALAADKGSVSATDEHSSASPSPRG